MSSKIAVGALFGLMSLAVAGAGAPAAAQDRGKSLDHHNTNIQTRKYAGWQRTRNGSWVQPVGDPRYPGASPSGGEAIMTKDDMDADAFKPARMINPYGEVRASRHHGTVIYYQPSGSAMTTEGPAYIDESTVQRPANNGRRYVDNGSVYSQESTVPPRL